MEAVHWVADREVKRVEKVKMVSIRLTAPEADDLKYALRTIPALYTSSIVSRVLDALYNPVSGKATSW